MFSNQCHNNRKIGAIYQLTPPWGKTLTCTLGRWQRLPGRWWWGAGGCQFGSYRCCSRSPDSRHWCLSVQIDYLPCHYRLSCFVYILDMPLRHQLRVLDILLNGLYLYMWLYVDSCFPLQISVNKILLLLWACCPEQWWRFALHIYFFPSEQIGI